MTKRDAWKLALVSTALLALVVFFQVGGANWLQTTAPAQTKAATPVTASQYVAVHAQGETRVTLNPKRVAVFDIGALDTLNALNVEVMGVAGKTFPSYLQSYLDSRYLNMGSLFEPDYEAVNAAKPDLIITGLRSSSKYQQLARLAPTIDMPSNDLQPVKVTLDNARMLGALFGKEQRVEELSTQIRHNVAALREKTSTGGKGLIVLVTGGRISAYGPGSRFGVLHSDFGVPPAAPDLAVSLHGEAIGSEFILKTNPDWLFVIDRDVAVGATGAAQQVLDNPLVRQTNAWQKGNVLYLDPSVWYLAGGGIQALGRMIAQVEEGYGRTGQ
ncbi:siderophore ABC transporter substrate-binding protein [Pseudomonas cichorii]|uniref:siderophore ABC transporter substrate-binding protein n=1 Tax=Pseudomonas cichorii TaxID=36746 RepID=UPI0018E61812|nr:siderophore ABC transporter substrate-binding protein [Pseudomonas cichorii]MBI6854251.1 siderophore ABC transporter substrate-binding protein [Pseudomonas cichorii]